MNSQDLFCLKKKIKLHVLSNVVVIGALRVNICVSIISFS